MGKVFDFRTYFRPLVAAATLLTAGVAVADRTVDTEIERADDAYQPNMGVSPIVVPQYVPSAEEQETERKKQERDAFERNETYEQRQLRLQQERERQEEIDTRAAQERKWREQAEASAARTDAERYHRASMRVEDVKAGLAGKQTWSVEDYVRIMDVAEPAWIQMEYYAREGFRVHGNDMALYYAVARHLGAPYGNPSSLEYKKESMDILVRVFDTDDRLAQVRACAIFMLGREGDRKILKKGVRQCRQAFGREDGKVYEAFWADLRKSTEHFLALNDPFYEKLNMQYQRWRLIRHPLWAKVLETNFSDTSYIQLMLNDIKYCGNGSWVGNYCPRNGW